MNRIETNNQLHAINWPHCIVQTCESNPIQSSMSTSIVNANANLGHVYFWLKTKYGNNFFVFKSVPLVFYDQS